MPLSNSSIAEAEEAKSNEMSNAESAVLEVSSVEETVRLLSVFESAKSRHCFDDAIPKS